MSRSKGDLVREVMGEIERADDSGPTMKDRTPQQLAETLRHYTDGKDMPKDPNERIAVIAKSFARLLLEDAGDFDSRKPETTTEWAADRVMNNDYFRRTRERDRSVEGDDPLERDFALSELAGSVNEARHYSGDDEWVSNSLDPSAVLEKLVEAVMERGRR